MFCKFCGAKIEDNANFCSKCGAKLNIEEKTDTYTTNVVDTEITNLNKNNMALKNIPDKAFNIIQKVITYCLILGIVGVAIFLGIVLVGLIAYGHVYLFGGNNFTKALSIISIVLMLIGLCGIITKSILCFIFKIEQFPKTIVKKVILIALAFVCLGCSIWGFVDCGNNKSDNSPKNGSYNEPAVSKYLGLSVEVTDITTSVNFTYVYCIIKNISYLYGNGTMYRNIQVKAVFKDKSGSILDTDLTYAVDSAGLNFGETKTFYYLIRNTNVQSADLSIV